MADMTNQDGQFAICETVQETDLNQAAFEALTFVDVENIVNVPALGYTENIISQDYLNKDLSGKRKGFKVGTEEELLCGYDPAATGQTAVETASATKSNFAVKRTLQDGTVIYSRAIIAANGGIQGGGGEDFTNISWMIAVNQLPIVVTA